MPKISPRIVGLGLIAASGVSTLVHRAVWETARHGPPQLAEAGLGLATFVLASTGILLLIHGAALFRRDVLGRPSPMPARPVDVGTRFVDRPGGAGRAFDTRQDVSLMQARHAIAASRMKVDARPAYHEVGRHHPVPHRR